MITDFGRWAIDQGIKTRQALLKAGIKAAEERGITAFTALDVHAWIETEITVKTALYYYYTSMRQFRATVRDEAVRTKNPRLIVQIAALNPPMIGDLTLSRSLILQSMERFKQYIQAEAI